MRELLHELLVLLTSSPYLYMLFFFLVVIFVAVILLILFRKKISGWIKQFFAQYSNGIEMKITNKKTIAFEKNDNVSNSAKSTIIQQVELENSEITSVKGPVTMDKVKMKNSYIGEIRSE